MIEARYAPGSGFLLGAGARWLLLAEDPGQRVLDEVYAVLLGHEPVVERVLDLLDKRYPLGLPSLVLVDLTPGATETAARGEGRLVHDGDRRLLGVGASEAEATLRLVGGVVTASHAVLTGRPAAGLHPPPRPSSRAASTPAGPTGRPLIDGVPPHLLAAPAPSSEPAPGADPDPAPAAPDPDPAPAPAAPDHDGHTTQRPRTHRGEPSVIDPLAQPDPDLVLAVHCPSGHLTDAMAPACRICQATVPGQTPRRVPRPSLGVLRLPTGEVVPLDRGVVLGRRPGAVPGGEPWPHLVHLPADSTYLSRRHLQIELDGWLVLATDLGSSGGTRRHATGREPELLRAHEPYVLEHGDVLDLADLYAVTFSVTPDRPADPAR